MHTPTQAADMNALPRSANTDTRMRLQDVSRGYQSSVVLLTACHLGVFDALGDNPRAAAGPAQTPAALAAAGPAQAPAAPAAAGPAQTPTALAAALRLDPRALEIVLLALASDGFLKRSAEGFRLSEDYAPYLLSGGAQTQASILRHNYNCLRRWCQLEEVVRTGQPAPREDEGPEDMRAFICGMADISRLSSAETADKLDLSPYRRMLDVGGGPGTAAIEFARRNPAMRCVVFDLEGPIGIAREEIRKAGLADRVETRVGDYFRDELGSEPGEGFDLVYVSNIIHSMGPADTRMLFGKSHRALVPGGTLIVKDFFLEDDRITPNTAALFSVNMLVGTEQGRSYTLSETRAMLEEMGFADFRAIEVATASRLLIAHKTA